MKIDIRRVRLSRGCVVYEDTLRLMDFAACGLKIDAAQREMLDFNIDADSLSLRLQDRIIPTGALALRGRFGDERLIIDTCQIAIQNLTVSGDGRMALSADPVLNARVRIHGDFASLYEMLAVSDIAAPTGIIDAGLEAEGSLSDPKLVAKVSFESLKIDTLLLTDGRLRVTWQKRRIALDTLVMHVLGGHFNGHGTADLDAPAFSITADAKSLSFATLWSLMVNRSSPFHGRIDAQTLLEGNGRAWEGWRFQIHGRTENFSYHAKPLDPILIDGRFSGGVLSAVLSQGNTRVETALEIRRNRIEGGFAVSIPSLDVIGALADQPDLTGRLSARGKISGVLDDPTLEVEIHADAVRYRQFPLDRLSGVFRLANHEAIFQNFTFEGSRTSEDTTALFSLDGFRGGLDYSGVLDGPVTNPSGQITVSLDRPAWQDQTFDSGSLHARLIPDSLILDAATLARDTILIHAAGRVARRPLSGTGRLSLFSRAGMTNGSTDTLTMKNLGALSCAFHLLPQGIEARVTGRRFNLAPLSLWIPDSSPRGVADFTAQIYPGRRGQFDGHVEPAEFQNLIADSLTVRAEWTSDELRLNHFALHHAGDRLELAGHIPLQKTSDHWPKSDRMQPILVQAQSTRFDLEFLAPLLPAGWSLTGRCDADVHLEGTLNSPQLDGNLTIADAGLRLQTQTVLDSMNVRLHLANRKARLERLTGRIYGLPVFLTGEANLGLQHADAHAEGRIADQTSLKLDGRLDSGQIGGKVTLSDFNLALLAGFVPSNYKLSGKAQMEIGLSGTTADPTLGGNLSLTNFSVKPIRWMSAVKTNNLRVRLSDHEAILDTVRFTTERGSGICSGRLIYYNRKIASLGMNGRIQNVAFTEKDQFCILVKNGTFRVGQDSSRREVIADIQLADSRYIGRLDVKQIIDRIRAPKRPEIQSTTSGGWALEVHLHDSPDVWIDNNLAHIRMKPEVRLRGNTNRPTVSGRVTATEGYFTYLDRKFTLQSGTLDFTDPYRINPIIDLTAKTELKGYQTFSGTAYTVQLRVTGAVDQAVIGLTSEPVLSEPDIVSLLTLGTTRKAATSESGGRDVTLTQMLQERAAQLSSQRISGYAAHRIGVLLGMEDVTIEGNLFRFGKSWGPQLLASKKLTDRMEVTYSSTIGNLNEQSIRLDYKLSKVFSIEGQTDQKGRAGLDLKYRIKFK